MKNNPNRFWLLVVLLGWLFDFLFWDKPAVGINFILYVILSLGTGIYLLKMDGLRLAPRSSLLLFPIAFLSAVVFFRQEPLTAFLSIAMTLFLMGVFALTYLNGQWLKYGLLDYFLGYLQLIASVFTRPISFNADVKKEQPSTSGKRSSRIWPIVRGIVIALPVIAIFASLLSAADPIFEKRFADFIELFNIDNLPEYIFRLVYILIFAYALAGIFLHAAQKSGGEIDEKAPVSQFLGFTEAGIVLGSVVVLFLVFVIIQFQYFFGGQANINIEGYTYSEYARKGFGELVAVAFFSLLMLLVLGAITRRETDGQRRFFSALGVTLVGLVIVMLISAFQRLVLYEFAYGFSRLRTYTHVFMIWLALLLVAVVVLEVLRRDRAIGLTMVLAALGFVISLGIMNVDAFIVRQNVQREINGYDEFSGDGGRVALDNQYFLELSDDAIPPLVAAFSKDEIPSDVHDKIGVSLACIRHERGFDEQDVPWQSFHLSRFFADQALTEIETKLDAYQLVETDRSWKVKTLGGEEVYCWPYYSD